MVSIISIGLSTIQIAFTYTSAFGCQNGRIIHLKYPFRGHGKGAGSQVKRLTKNLNRLLEKVVSKLRQRLVLAKSSLELSQRAESLCISIEEELEDIYAWIGRVTNHTRVGGSGKQMAEQHDSVCVNALRRVGMLKFLQWNSAPPSKVVCDRH